MALSIVGFRWQWWQNIRLGKVLERNSKFKLKKF
jgi:hypothetical protein